ncbi:MAG: glycosyltransferase, partial [Microgenomates group bacterium]
TDDSIEWLLETFKLKEFSKNEYRSTQRIQKKKIDFLLLINSKNMRFGAAVNKAVQNISNDLFFLLNNDVEPTSDVLTFLIPHFQKHNIFAVGCLEYESLEHRNASGKSDLWFEKGLFHHSKAETIHAGDTAWVAGGSGLFSKEKWIELDGFDPAYYPAYWEDIDISHRARKKGWKVLFEPKAIVYHLHESTNRPVFGDASVRAMSWRSADIFTWKHSSIFQKLLFIIWRPFWILKRMQVSLLS